MNPPNSLIAFFEAENQTSTAGGKGNSLSVMTRAGVPVPPGFTILTTAFDLFIIEAGLKGQIASEINNLNQNDTEALEITSKNIMGLILNPHMPDPVAGQVYDAFDRLGSQYVAVRSSATAEDSQDAAWAGQLESFLNTNRQDLLRNVQKCWASLFSPRALFYRLEQKADDISVAVVVQSMVESEVSGIAFSAHPITQDKNEIVIESSYGLGEAIVSGQVTPDNFIVKKSPFGIVQKNIHTKSRRLSRDGSGSNNWHDIDETTANHPSLSGSQILELAKLIIEIEKHYGFACDIEWAFKNNRFYIVQARPITTIVAPKKPENFVDTFLAEVGSEQVSVFEGEFLPLLIIVDWLNYLDEGGLNNIYPIVFYKQGSLAKFYASGYRYNLVSRRLFLDYLESKASPENINRQYESSKRKINDLYNGYHDQTTSKSVDDLQASLHQAHECLKELVSLTLFLDTLDRSIVESVVHDRSMNVDMPIIWEAASVLDFSSFETEQLKDIIRVLSNGTAISKLQYAFTNYTHVPDVSEINNLLNDFNLEEAKADLVSRESKLVDAKNKKHNLKENLNAKERQILNFIDWSAWLRDDRKSLINKCDALLFNLVSDLFELWDIDKKLVGVVTVFDVFRGIEYIKDNAENLQKRIQRTLILQHASGYYQEEFNNIDIEKLEHRIHPEQVNQNEIVGEVASSGIAKGRVRIILSKSDFAGFNDGEILVTSMTRPEYVPLMKKAAAIITDEGGITSHAAIVSRELNKPCVIGTKVATRLLKDGEEVEVDAEIGIIKRL